MKPKYIFGAVFAICILMVTVLPQLAHSSHATAARAVPIPTIAPLPLAASQPTPTAPPVQTQSPTPVPAVTDPPALTAGATDHLPSPVDSSAQPGQAANSIPATSSLPDLAAFIASVSDGQANRLAGVYVPGQFALQVVQQPNGDGNFVSSADQTVTEYNRSAAYGVVGLLAHNISPSGEAFFKLKPGQAVTLIYGDGRQAHYQVAQIEDYQALSPNDPFSDFIDLNGPGGNLVRNEDLFRQIYTKSGQLVFQTCLNANGDPSWGRVFVIAGPT